MSIIPGMIQRPRASIWVAPAGIVTAVRGPMAVIREPDTTMTASLRGGPPVPSMTVAPTIAVVAAWNTGSGRDAETTIAERHRTNPSVQRVVVMVGK